MTLPRRSRPRHVPRDWIEVDCANPSCSLTTWVPAGTMAGTQVIVVCSIACAAELAPLQPNPPLLPFVRGRG